MLNNKLIPELLMRLHDDQLLDSTIKSIINVVSALMSHRPSNEDIRRCVCVCVCVRERDCVLILLQVWSSVGILSLP